MKNDTRRNLLRTLTLGGGAFASTRMPAAWKAPIVEAVILPAHAQATDNTDQLGTAAASDEQTTASTTQAPASTTQAPVTTSIPSTTQVPTSTAAPTTPAPTPPPTTPAPPCGGLGMQECVGENVEIVAVPGGTRVRIGDDGPQGGAGGMA